MWMDIDLVPKRSDVGPAPDDRSEARSRGRPEPGRRTAARAVPDGAAVVALVVVPTVVLLLLIVALV